MNTKTNAIHEYALFLQKIYDPDKDDPKAYRMDLVRWEKSLPKMESFKYTSKLQVKTKPIPGPINL